VLCVLVLVCACAKTPPAVQPTTIEVVRTETVDRPVYVKTPLPTELLEAFSRLVLPVFVSPTDPNASSALTPEGERVWLAFLEQVKAIRRALEAHAAP
jgi:hypothetical protein